LESFLEKLLFIVQVGEASNVLPLGKPYWHPQGSIQWGSPLYFHKVRFDNKEKFGWNISLTFRDHINKLYYIEQQNADNNRKHSPWDKSLSLAPRHVVTTCRLGQFKNSQISKLAKAYCCSYMLILFRQN
jgi:hypothetical protein